MNVKAGRDGSLVRLPQLDKPGLQAPPRRVGHVGWKAGPDHINVTFEAPKGGDVEPTIFFLLLFAPSLRVEGQLSKSVGGGEESTICLSSLRRDQARRTRGALRMTAAGLSPGTHYESFGVAACSTRLHAQPGNGCDLFHPTECTAHLLPRVATAQPAVTGRINDGSFDGGGWVLVRRVPPGPSWHPAQDDLSGEAEYGGCEDRNPENRDPGQCGPTADAPFSVRFDDIAWEEMLYSSGDETRWLIMARPELAEKVADADGRIKLAVRKSHLHHLDYLARVRVESEDASDPLVRTDLRPSAEDPLLYAEADRPTAEGELEREKGANVWVRPWVVVDRPQHSTDSAGGAAGSGHTETTLAVVSADGHQSTLQQQEAAQCLDFNRTCPSWAHEGECDANADFMNRYCCASCVKFAPMDHCIDHHSNCGEWANRGRCESRVQFNTVIPSMMPFMSRSCCASCTQPVVGKGCIDVQPPMCDALASMGHCESNRPFMSRFCCQSCTAQMSRFVCKDHVQSCSRWALEYGECSDNKPFMRKKCCASCCTDTDPHCGDRAAAGLCQTDQNVREECCDSCCQDAEEHGDQCGNWAAAGECTSNPMFMRANCCHSCLVLARAQGRAAGRWGARASI
jgi:hypothetical protein